MRPGIVVIGGAGVFGGRLVERLAATSDLRIVVAGRSLERATATVETLRRRFPGSPLEATALDRDDMDPQAIRALGATIVVDAAGPFQGHAPKVATAAIAAGCHYVDLADARDFVSHFGQLAPAARESGVVAITGASSTPALSNAVLDRLTAGWLAIEAIDVMILPGNRAPRGLSVVRAILAYAGKPVGIWIDGAWREEPGWSRLRRVRIAGLGPRWVSLCETPDLDVLPLRFPGLRRGTFAAGLELGFLHLGLWAASFAVRLGFVASLAPLARPFRWLAGLFESFGSDRGAMVVEAMGVAAGGCAIRARWTLVAASGVGQIVPVLPALILIKRLATADAPEAGAYSAVGQVSLAEIEAELTDLPIETSICTERIVPLFERVLGNAFAHLPAPLRYLHLPVGSTTFAGEAHVEGGATAPGRWIAALFGFPRAGIGIPVHVTIAEEAGGETWGRRFGNAVFSSRMRETRRGLEERFGIVSVALSLSADTAGIDMQVVGARIGPVPLPRFLSPWSQARESADEHGRFRFDVEIGLPIFGRLVRYRGWLVPAAPQR